MAIAVLEAARESSSVRQPRVGLIAALAAVLALATMSASIAGPFIFDDIPLIHGNSYVHDFASWRRWFTGTLWDSNFDPALARETRDFWRPLVLLSYAVNWVIGSGSPLVFHATNLAVHALNVGLLMYVLLGWVGRLWPAALGALVFAVHPVQAEPVAWIAGRTDSLCTLGLLLTTLGIRRFRSRRGAGIALQAGGIAIAFTAKEAAIVLPVLAAIELWSEHKPSLDLASVRRVLLRVWPYLGLSIAYVVLHRWFVSTGKSEFGVTASNHAPLVLEAVGRYTALLLWPDDLTLGRAQLRFRGNVIVGSVAYAALGALSIVGLLLVSWRSRRRAPALALGLLAYAAMLLPVSGLIWVGTDVLVSPRFLYVPMLGLSLAVAALASQRPYRSRVARGLCVMLLACLALRSFMRAGDFETEQAFWRREITQNPNYGPAQQYFLYRELNAGRPRAALELAYRWFELTRGGGMPEARKAKLITAILAATLRALPDLDTEGLANVQRFARVLSRGEPATLSVPALGLALDVARNPSLLNELKKAEQRLWMIAAEAAVRRGDDAAAVELVEAAVLSCAGCWTLLSNSALILARAHRLERALELAELALRLAPPGKISDIVTIVREAMRWDALKGSAPPAVVEAGMQSALGSFGRAYRSARLAIENPPSEPASVLSLAELAFRAGDADGARRLLERILPAPGVERTLLELARSVSWLDRPRPADEWMPPA